MSDKGKEAIKDLKIKTCGEFQYKTFLVNRSDAIAILEYVEELEKYKESHK